MDDVTIKRTTVIAIILAIFFGVLQKIPENKKYNTFIPEMALNVISTAFFQIVLFIFLIYFVLIGINLSYGTKNMIPEKILKIFYNSGILITFLIIFLTVAFGLIINLIILTIIPAKIGGYLILLILFFTAIVFGILERNII